MDLFYMQSEGHCGLSLLTNCEPACSHYYSNNNMVDNIILFQYHTPKNSNAEWKGSGQTTMYLWNYKY